MEEGTVVVTLRNLKKGNEHVLEFQGVDVTDLFQMGNVIDVKTLYEHLYEAADRTDLARRGESLYNWIRSIWKTKDGDVTYHDPTTYFQVTDKTEKGAEATQPKELKPKPPK